MPDPGHSVLPIITTRQTSAYSLPIDTGVGLGTGAGWRDAIM